MVFSLVVSSGYHVILYPHTTTSRLVSRITQNGIWIRRPISWSSISSNSDCGGNNDKEQRAYVHHSLVVAAEHLVVALGIGSRRACVLANSPSPVRAG